MTHHACDISYHCIILGTGPTYTSPCQ